MTTRHLAAVGTGSTADQGRMESLDGWWVVSWDHDHNGPMTYTVELLDDGSTYVARRDYDLAAWVLAPSWLATVDMERVIPNGDPEWMELVELLNRAHGIGVPGLHTWRADR